MAKKKDGFLISIILTTIFMGSSFPTGKYLISIEHVPPFLLGGYRFVLAGLIMLVWVFLTKGYQAVLPTSQGKKLQGWILVLVIGLLQTTGTMGLLNLALAMGLSGSMSSIILFTNPLWLALLAHFLLKDRLNLWKIIALICGFLGVVVCLGFDKSAFGLSALVALFGAICWAVNTVITKKVPFDKGPFIFTGWQLFIGGLFMFIFALAFKENYNMVSLSNWGWLWFVWLVIPASVGSFGLWFSSLQKREASLASSFLFLVPLFSTLFSIIGLKEKFSLSLVVGGILVIISLILVNKKTKPRA
ncbi:DMT family transporter [Lactococcus termiticola]|uniref:Drug/metabolite transporter permease n=1 Tax=Lactococcus termiticola TaxID=2169526 RepID=A0A2R5HD91_9LACT|nr:DMT family transporter [Lactococcus termiticola]GBG96044.1 drug/metabolite transporter permease [Lactococcus termiticola]